MQRYIVKRVLQALLTLVALSVVVFFLARVGGDPVRLMLGFEASQQEVERVRETMGLNKPLPTQYWIFITKAVRGDFGKSIYEPRPASEIVMEKFPATVKLALFTSVFAFPIGVLIGVLCAIKRNRLFDILGRTLAVLGQSIPSFWVGIVAILLFSVRWEVFPATATGGLISYVLPAIAMGAFAVASMTRLTRSSMLDVLSADYVAFAKARGIPEASVVLRHALRNALIPVLTLSAVIFSYLITGSIVIETVFAWPGVGRLAYEAVHRNDFPVIQTIVLLFGTIFIFVNLVTDILYAKLDPRIRYQ